MRKRILQVTASDRLKVNRSLDLPVSLVPADCYRKGNVGETDFCCCLPHRKRGPPGASQLTQTQQKYTTSVRRINGRRGGGEIERRWLLIARP